MTTTTRDVGATAPSDRFVGGGHAMGEGLVAALALVGIAQRMTVGPGLTPRHAVIALLLPLWLTALRRYRDAGLFLALGVGALLNGMLLAATTDNPVDRSNALASMLLLLGTVGGVGVVLWARTVLADRWVGLWFGIGMIVSQATTPTTLGVDNPFKFDWSIPITVLVLAAFDGPSHRLRQLLSLVVIAVLSILSDARAMFTVSLLAVVLVLWQLRPTGMSRSRSWLATTGLVLALSAALYYAITTLLVTGLLGVEAQQRTQQQLDTAGSVIVGGRPELAASWALFTHRPLGFGPGVSVTPAELDIAKEGMSRIGYDPENTYVSGYLLGRGRIELHSTLADLWSHYGLLGIALCGVILYVLARRTSELILARRASALVLILTCWSLWNLMFSPFHSSASTWILVLGLLLARRGRGEDGSHDRHPASSGPGAHWGPPGPR